MKIPEQIQNISVWQFTYELPDERIAKYPLEQRDQSKLLVFKKGQITDDYFYNLHQRLPANSLLIFNNTKVIKARLHFTKETGAKIEVFLLDPHAPADYAQNFQQTSQCSWKCIVGNLKKWKSGNLSLKIEIAGQPIKLVAKNIGELGSGRIVEFSWDNPSFTFSEIIETAGNIPIPPYLNRESEECDNTRYQTVYSKVKGSVAAPTAGLHFSEDVFQKLKETGMSVAELTLHVGAGTFQPVKAENIGGHEMHTEHIVIDHSFIKKLLKHNGPFIAVGTTSIRTLESLYWISAKIKQNQNIDPCFIEVGQWDAYLSNETTTRLEALEIIQAFMLKNKIEQLQASTQIIIVPGYQFQMVDGMLTNFHQPQSTLLLLISAFVGDSWKAIYDHALANNYRFLSYGDSNLYLR